MSKKDKLLQEIGSLREARKDWFNILFAIASAIVILVYSVLSGDKPIYTLILGGIGFSAFIFIAFYYKNIETKIEQKLEELEKEE